MPASCESRTDRETTIGGTSRHLAVGATRPMAIKFTHIAPAANTAGFVSKYDLVQFYHVDDFAQWSSMMAGAPSTDPYLAADFNYDGVQDSMDLALFATAWTNLRRSADYNADGVVDSTDLTQFLAAAARTSPTGVDSDW